MPRVLMSNGRDSLQESRIAMLILRWSSLIDIDIGADATCLSLPTWFSMMRRGGDDSEECICAGRGVGQFQARANALVGWTLFLCAALATDSAHDSFIYPSWSSKHGGRVHPALVPCCCGRRRLSCHAYYSAWPRHNATACQPMTFLQSPLPTRF